MSSSDEVVDVTEWVQDGCEISISYYPVDGLWYVIAKRGAGDYGIRCRDVNKGKAIDRMLNRLKLAKDGPLFGQTQLYG